MSETMSLKAAWQRVLSLGAAAPDPRVLFAQDPSRTDWLTLTAGPVTADLSRHKISAEAIAALLALAGAADVEGKRRAMFDGVRINSTENRAVLHTALRAHGGDAFAVDGVSVMSDVLGVREKLYAFANDVRGGNWRGATGETISHVLHIGIGGSHLGPELVVRALRPFADGPEVRFVANVDPADLAAALKGLNPARTLVVVASKTFTTQETMLNATAARAWLTASLGDKAVAAHFVAASTNKEAVEAFGINPANMFPFDDWVGGRFSLWSAIGLPIALAIGPERFAQFLGGAHEMDQHFKTAPLAKNLPVMMALVDIWNRDALGMAGRVVLPYAQDLAKLPDFLQQLEMESNGKSVQQDGTPVAVPTCPFVFGQAGTNGQHAFHQQLHQGPEALPCEFVVPLAAHTADEALAPGQHRVLVANALAQASALLMGRAHDNPHRVMAGGRPSTFMTVAELTPHSLGALLALYEHKVAAAGFIWNINSFDQFGVELGKVIATDVLSGKTESVCPATRAFLKRHPL